ncbi:8043_t:CDS:10 [Racocetra persica]|uniref:8043_t:CDS:1 n=1 Tax=Racocetra persica TaxID=160502 RepID=A0ACA9LCE2_9GLOM|nr:8043_t:CDS:10 [Racocetra persica]
MSMNSPPNEVVVESDVTLEYKSMPSTIDIKKGSEDNIYSVWRDYGQSFSVNNPGKIQNYDKDKETNKSSINQVQAEDKQALSSIYSDSSLSSDAFPDKMLVHIKLLNFNPSRRLNSDVKQSIRIVIGSIFYLTKPSTSLEEQLKKKKNGRVIVPLTNRFPHLHKIGTIQINIKFHFSNDLALNSQTQSKVAPLIHDDCDCNECFNLEIRPETISLGILDTVLSQETRYAIKEITGLYHTFFGHGWRLTKLEFLKAYMLLEKYYSQKDNPITGNLCHDKNMIGDALRYLKFSMSSYGSFLFNWFGYGPPNPFGITSEKKIIRNFFGLDKNDIICWEYDQNAVSVPNYMVIRDPETNSIIVSIRGTMNVTDLVTDSLTHYESWNGGFVHRGILCSAQYLINHSLKDIRDAVIKYNADSIKIIGHSLGASVSSITTLLLRERCKDMLDRGINIHAWNFATLPCCSLDIASKVDTMKCIHNFINENDVIPRLSYGNLMDFKELVKFTASELKNEEYKEVYHCYALK